jgi:hypothetical protein
MVAATHLFDIAGVLKTEVIDIYALAGIGLPDRQVITEGGVAWDCELLGIELRQVRRGNPGPEADASRGVPLTPLCVSHRSAEFHIWIVRCVPAPSDSGDPPSVTDIEAAAQDIYTDAWLLPSGIQEAAAAGSLGAPCSGVFVGPAIIVGPQGGFVAVDLLVEYALGGP